MKVIVSFSLFIMFGLLQACGNGDTSVESRPVTEGDVPSEYVGTYVGTLSARAKSGALERSTSDTVTIIVSDDNRLRFQGDDPDEVFVTTVGANGNFNGSLPINYGDCSGSVQVSGNVNGVVAAGEIGGEGECEGIKVGLDGEFNARK